MADVQALGVLEPPVGGRDLEHRRVGQGRRPGRGQPAAGLDVAEQDVGQRVAELHARGTRTSSTAATSSRHGSSTGAPALTTTTVRGLAAATARTSSSCRPGSASDVAVEALALDVLGGADDHDRDVAARGPARRRAASSSSAGRAGGPTTSPTRKMNAARRGQRYRMRTSTALPGGAAATGVECCGGDGERPGGCRRPRAPSVVLEHASRRPRSSRTRPEAGDAEPPVAVLVGDEAGVHLELRGAARGRSPSSRTIVAGAGGLLGDRRAVGVEPADATTGDRRPRVRTARRRGPARSDVRERRARRR